jgi:hypothetical protein
MQHVRLLETCFTELTYFLVNRYSATNSVLPNNNQVHFQGKGSQGQSCTRKYVQCLCTGPFISCTSFLMFLFRRFICPNTFQPYINKNIIIIGIYNVIYLIFFQWLQFLLKLFDLKVAHIVKILLLIMTCKLNAYLMCSIYYKSLYSLYPDPKSLLR